MTNKHYHVPLNHVQKHKPARTKKYVAVASVIGGQKGVQTSVQIGIALKQAGIPSIIDGSSRYDIRVPADRQMEATRFLKQDANRNNYEITFY